jgi:hypothetical protein
MIHDDKKLLWLDFLFSDTNKPTLTSFAQKIIPRGAETKTVPRTGAILVKKKASCALIKLETPMEQHLTHRTNASAVVAKPTSK